MQPHEARQDQTPRKPVVTRFGLLLLGLATATGVALGAAAFAGSGEGQLPSELPYLDAEATALSGTTLEALIAQADGIAVIDVVAETGPGVPTPGTVTVDDFATYLVVVAALGKWSAVLVEAGFPGTPGIAMPIVQDATWLDGRRLATFDSPPLTAGRQYLVFVTLDPAADVVRVMGAHTHLLLAGKLYFAGARGLPGGGATRRDAAVAELAFWALPLDQALALIARRAPDSPQRPRP